MVESVKKLLEGFNFFVRWVKQLPYASTDGIWLYQSEALGICIVGFLLTYYFMNRRYRNLLICLFSILLLGAYRSTLYWLDRPRTSLVFYNVRGYPAIHCIESDRRSWVNYVDTISNGERLKRMTANYWRHHHLLPPKEIAADCWYMGFNRQRQIISYHDCHICVINDNHWWGKTTVSPSYIQYLYLCKRYDGHLEGLIRIFSIPYVILDASLSEYRRHLLESECKQSSLRFISLSDEGSVHFSLQVQRFIVRLHFDKV